MCLTFGVLSCRAAPKKKKNYDEDANYDMLEDEFDFLS